MSPAINGLLFDKCHSWKLFVDRPEIRYRFASLRNLNLSVSVDKPYILTQAGLMQARRIDGFSYWSPSRASGDGNDELQESLIENLSSSLPENSIFNASIVTGPTKNLAGLSPSHMLVHSLI